VPPDLDPATLTADERLRQVAALLAAGVLRLRDRAALPADPGEHPAPENPQENGQDSLEVLAHAVLTVHGG
jgi:hypothetical protein